MDLTVVIPSYRSELWVGRAIGSALDEGVRPQNLIVVEDGEFDGTAEVVRNFEGVRHVPLTQNRGAPHARNLGLAMAATRYVMFLDADDCVENGLLRGLVDALEHEGADLAMGPWVYDGEGRERGVLRTPPQLDNGERIFHWLIRAFYPPCCIAWRASSLREIGGWDEQLRKDQDGELVIRGLTRGLRVAVSTQGNGVYWQHDSPHRVTRAQIDHVMHAAEVVYAQIREWVNARTDPEQRQRYRAELGRYCCKTAWVAYSSGRDDAGEHWSDRARALGFSNPGYNTRSALLAAVLGMRMSSRLKARTGTVYRRIAQR